MGDRFRAACISDSSLIFSRTLLRYARLKAWAVRLSSVVCP